MTAIATSEDVPWATPALAAAEDVDWVSQALEEALSGGYLARSSLGADHRRLRQALFAAASGGKRFRPRLVAVVHDVLGGTAQEALPQVAAAIELLHTAFVVHDDVIDGDQTRRGTPTVPDGFRHDARAAGADATGARTYALAGGVLTGDLALSAAFRAVAGAAVPAPVSRRLLDLVDRALAVSAVGELTDVRLSLDLTVSSLGEALTMDERKTAAYSFELPMQAGAVLAGAAPDLVEGVGRVGRSLGIAFQLRDDLLGVFGDPETTGKSNVADLREGKRTPLVVHARGTASWPVVEQHLGDPDLDAGAAAEVRRALEVGGSRRFVEHLADQHVASAVSRAAQLGLPQGFVGSLEDLCGLAPGGRT